MAVPLSADQITAALRAEGCRIQEHRLWRTHNRNHKGPWGPVHGVMLHHTVSKGELSSVELCYNGYPGLPGPLCQSVIPKSGTVYLTGHGRCNHAGGGDPNVLAAVKDERYGDRPPVPMVGNDNGVDGNAHFYGAECVNLGDDKDPWEPEQVDAMVRWAAAICRAHGWTEKSVIAHREWSRDKSDPAGPGMPSMTVMRAKIAERLAHPPSWNPPKTGTPMALPNLTTLFRTENVTLLKDVPYTVYFTEEYADDAQGHGAGGKTVLTGAEYTGTFNVRVTGLMDGERVDVFPVEEDASGNFLGAGVPSSIAGWGGSEEVGGDVQRSTSVTGRVGQRLAFQVVNRGYTPVTLEEASVVLLSWPNA